MRCVTSVSFSVKINGSLSIVFRPTRGLRQGDPISPYLFLLCAEGFSSLLKLVGPVHLSRGVRVGIHSSWISHLLFTDDSIIFSEASQRGADRLKAILDTYHKGSGHLVNKEKSAVFFSKNSTEVIKNVVLETLQIPNEALAEKYLGLPTALGRSTEGAFEYMTTRKKGLVGAWSGKEASCAGREVLIKSQAQAVTTYPMSFFIIPLATSNKMKRTISNYWWGSSADNKGMHWMRWELLTRPKVKGGMGFRDLHLFNKALLGKQGWRLMEQPESLCARVLKGRYYHDGEFLTAKRKKHTSHTWRAIMKGREVLYEGLIRRLGDGRGTNVWNDRWITNHPLGKPFTQRSNHQIQVVSELLPASLQWNETLLREIFCDFLMLKPFCLLLSMVEERISGHGSASDMVRTRFALPINC
ncbi:hypothetical protein PR202_ga25254 [Eleusine coracana subsp. coracana]|uniref:Reverse transcriptase domain-containing protein n=1 Tax=Eleusine coracana subsp. coracana TaxID=191504 RepID=A0AAV5D8W4_ELECO|nr:hypothetical protein PR202_ga25254 [Eleusine coracana subsp. coracana]